MSPLGLLFVAATVWMVFMVSHKRSGRSGGFFLLTTLGVVSILAGLFAFTARDAQTVSSRIVDASIFEDGPEIDVQPPNVEVNFDRGFPFRSIRPDIKVRPPIVDVNFDRGFPFRESDSVRRMPSWMAISLGAMLLIVGSLLVTRGRTRPLALKALTLLGAGAVVYSLVSFFSSTPRPIGPHDRIVRVNSQTQLAPPVDAKVQKPKRPSRAKRPASRPERPSISESPVETLPPRAGSIPVDAELAKSEAPAAPPAAATPDKPAIAPEEKEKPAVPSPAASPEVASPAPAEATAQPPGTASPDKPAAPPEEDKPAVAAESKDAPAAAAATSSPAVAPVANEKPIETPVANVAPAAPPPPAPAPPAIAIAPSASTAAPAIAPEVSQGRPAWVDAPARLNNSVYSITVNSGLFVTVPECQRQLDVQMKHEADHYIDEYVGERASQLVDIPLSYLRDHVKKAEYAELVRSESVGPMHQIHALLEFDDQARSDFRRMWHNAVVTDRLWYTGSGAALVLALLGTFYGYLRLDLRTGGAQKGRLQLAATLVALIIAAGALLARWAVPF